MAVSSYLDSGAMSTLKEDNKTFDNIEIQIQLQAASMSKFNDLSLIMNGQATKSLEKQLKIEM